MLLRCRTAVMMCLPLMSACAGHTVAHVAPDESRPHMTWEIRSGGGVGDDRFVCGSSKPSQDCVLTASTAARPELATVHLYLHAARRQTSYLGVVDMPFIQGFGSLEAREVSATVPPDSQPVGSTVNGRVTSKPGGYTFRVSLDAMQAGASTSQHIEEQVPVSVR